MKFASSLEAEFGVDLYANPYENISTNWSCQFDSFFF
jgi:hypothetical protein